MPRTRPDGQPDHANPIYKSEHILTNIGDCSLTEFALGNCVLDDVPIGGGVVYEKWNDAIKAQVEAGILQTEFAPVNRLIQFDWQTLHRGSPATKNGWRMFIRISRNTDRKIQNEIRNQTQVYLPALEAGW